MKTKNSHIADMLFQLCSTLAECQRVINKGGSYAVRRAEAIIAAVEPQAIDCLDEELCNIPRIKEAVFGSLSIPLVTHLASIARTSTLFGSTEWTMLTLNATPAQISALLDLGLLPNDGTFPLLASLVKRDSQEMRELIHTRVSPASPLDAKTVTELIDFKGDGLEKDIARILQDHVRLYPEIMTQNTQLLLEKPTPYYAVYLILAGVAPADLRATGANQINYTSFLISSLQSNHGLLALKKHCPDLVSTLKDKDGYLAFERAFSKSYREQQAQIA